MVTSTADYVHLKVSDRNKINSSGRHKSQLLSHWNIVFYNVYSLHGKICDNREPLN